MTEETILVTGASGDLARRVIEILLERGARNIIGTTRRPVKVDYLQDLGVTLRSAGFDDPTESLARAFTGATKLILISTTDFQRRSRQHRNAIDAARLAGVKHVIYTSLQSADSSPATGADSHRETEAYLRGSGLSWTILRNNLYMEGLLLKLSSAITIGSLSGNAGPGRFAFVSREDCARAAAGAALLPLSEVAEKLFDITGPRALSYEDLAQVLSQLTGKSIPPFDFNQSYEEFRKTVMSWGIAESFATAIASFDLAAKEGKLGKVTNDVARLAGSSPQDIEAFLGIYQGMLLSQV